MNYCWCIIVAVVLSACQERNVSKEELLTYIYTPENGTSHSVSKSGIESIATFKPAELIVYNELLRDATYNKDSLSQRYGSIYYFEITLSGKIPPTLHSQISSYVFTMADYVQLVGGSGKVVKLKDVHFPRLYGISGEMMFLVAFEAEEVASEETILLQINEFGLGVGQLNHPFRLSDLQQLPRLDFSTIKSV